jgi:FixJ family two-component response regulator
MKGCEVSHQASRIIVVEDDISVSKALVRLLGVAGFQVLAFNSAESYLQSNAAEPFGCMILDINLPGISGLELYNQLSAAKPVPVIFVTAHDEPAARAKVTRDGVIVYLTKPFRARTLIGAVRRLLGGATITQSN